MHPQQKRAISVMLESVKHQIQAIEQLLAEPYEDAPPARGGHRVTRPTASSPDSAFLSDEEEEELESLLEPDPELKTAMMARFMDAVAKEGAVGDQAPFVEGGSQG